MRAEGVEGGQVLAGALREFDEAVGVLCAPSSVTVERDGAAGVEVRTTAPLYAQVRESVEGARGTGVGGAARSLPPVRVDVLDWLRVVDATVAGWTPELVDRSTPERLDDLTRRRWRPQDVDWLVDAAQVVRRWAAAASEILSPSTRVELRATACPACGATHGMGVDEAGLPVRRAALVIDEAGSAVCRVCRTVWGPERLMMLAAILREQLPGGVLL